MPRGAKTPSGVIRFRPVKGPPRPEVVVLPWLDVKTPLKVGRIHFLPLANAVTLLGETVGALLKEHTADLKDEFGYPVRPTIALKDKKVRIATGHLKPPGPFIGPIEKLSFVATLYNCLCQGKVHGNSNATTFNFYYQALGGGGPTAYDVERRYGHVLKGGAVASTVRPMHAGQFDTLDDLKGAVLSALVQCRDKYVAKSLHLFYEASKDGGDREAALVLMAAAFEALLGAPGASNTKARTLLAAFDTDLKLFKRQDLWGGVLGAARMLGEHRNIVVHPYNNKPLTLRLPRRKNVPEMAIYERCYIALVLAYLVDLKLLQPFPEISTIVVGTEVWLHDANDDWCRLRTYRVQGEMVRRSMKETLRAFRAKSKRLGTGTTP